MATISPVYTQFSPQSGLPADQGVYIVTWTMANGDTALPAQMAGFSDRSVHIFGTFGGATVALLSSNDPEMSDFEAALDMQGTAISATSAKFDAIGPVSVYIKPTVTSGSGTSVTIAVCMVRGRI
jgi:hypothetical protein